MQTCVSPPVAGAHRCVAAGHRVVGSSGTRRLEQLGAGGVLRYRAALYLPSAAERLQRTRLHQLCGRISRLPGLYLHTAGEHAGTTSEPYLLMTDEQIPAHMLLILADMKIKKITLKMTMQEIACVVYNKSIFLDGNFFF